jgi:UDP:flavonoid glycosyltransferase YjiC (YdhE family)
VADILFVTWDGGGAVPPALGIARELQARGHAVRFLGHPEQADALRARGVEVAPSRHTRGFAGRPQSSTVALMAVFAERALGRDLLDAVAERPADLVVVDCFMFGALDAARRAGLPYVVLESTFDAYYERICLRGPLALSLRLRGLAPRRAVDTARVRLVTSMPELDPAGAAPHLTHVGPVVDVAPRVSGDPMLLVSLSTFGYPGMERVLQNVVDATRDIDARIVVTTGPLIDPAALRRPAHIEVHRFVPHVQLMPEATALVGHGGHGTTMQALAHDLPVLVLPMDGKTDQPAVGRAVTRAGAGLVASRKAGPEELATLIAALLEDGPHRALAARLGATIRAMPGAANGADRIEETLRDGVPSPGRRAPRP